MEPIRLKIEGLSLSLSAVETTLMLVPGVMSVQAEPDRRAVRVEAADSVTGDELVAALQKIGCVATVAG
jgi:copper chaperone CopZ